MPGWVRKIGVAASAHKPLGGPRLISRAADVQPTMRTIHDRRAASILASVLVVSMAGSTAGAACTDPGAAVSLPLPSPEQLEAQGVRIGSIDIDVEDIFDLTQPGESAIPYRLANELHVRTRSDAIRSQLLFGESDPYSRQRVAETERLLRGRRYLYDSWIEPTCYHPDTHAVDLQVRVCLLYTSDAADE